MRPAYFTPDYLLTPASSALHETYTADTAKYNAIRSTILGIRGGNASQTSVTPSGMATQSQSNRNPYYNNSYGSYNSGSSSMAQQGYTNGGGYGATSSYTTPRASHSDSLFKNTPFYTIESRVGNLHPCPAMNNHRNSVTITLKSSEFPELSRCATNLPTKLMLFCGSDNTGPQDIQFPHQSEIKINGDDVKHNLRGLKNKPGSTHPVDITPFFRLKQANYTNNVEFTYALTDKKFYLAVYVCKTHSIDELVTKIRTRKISKASVIKDISKKANDPDVVATSQNLSLLCPLSYTRLKVPCRGMSCNHIQCFDAKSFMQLQEQGPTWSCPICYKPAPFETLAIDEYVQEVLEKTSDSQQQVTIEPDGRWRTKVEEQESSRSRAAPTSKVEDDDDLSILSDTHAFGNGTNGFGGRNSFATPSRSLGTNGASASASRGTPNTQRSGSNKRPAEVIDLTLSSDEDDEPIVRAPKRQYQGPSSNGLSSFPSAYNAY
ncbi:zf-MIZ-domain-containing protein [Hypoxylon trugodes]|uniref:zf-MIZ-domain-containing protein n=1 Tax=Hypoxylon trugodes TaxID=326681 RepID=UPI0021917440|nr:zf-MIZ-domain-containing protein [Hypoxylon trugodes]KAI1393483.1 zf-MIZ-domain-containing protein [Hypoxylon trugodes]